MTRKRGLLINSIITVAMAGAVELFLLLCLAFFRNAMGVWYAVAIVGGTVINLSLACAEIVFFFKNKQVFYKSIITVFICILFVGVLFYALLKTNFFYILRDEEAFKEYLEKAGVWMGLLFVLLQFLQVVVLPIPSFVTVAAGTALFGPLLCALYSLAGILLGSVTAFLIGRYVGHKAVSWIIGEETLNKWLKKVKGRDKLFLSAMFLLPVFPDDVLCFVAGLSSMSFPFFLVVIVLSRVVAIFTTCYSVTLIPFNTWWGITLWALFFVGVVILFVILYKKSEQIERWLNKKLHRETKIEENEQSDFTVEIVSPDGNLVEKGVNNDDSPTKKQ